MPRRQYRWQYTDQRRTSIDADRRIGVFKTGWKNNSSFKNRRNTSHHWVDGKQDANAWVSFRVHLTDIDTGRACCTCSVSSSAPVPHSDWNPVMNCLEILRRLISVSMPPAPPLGAPGLEWIQKWKPFSLMDVVLKDIENSVVHMPFTNDTSILRLTLALTAPFLKQPSMNQNTGWVRDWQKQYRFCKWLG